MATLKSVNLWRLYLPGSLFLVYLLLSIFLFESDPVISLFLSLYEVYINLAESIANAIFNTADAGVFIENHTIVFDKLTDYTASHEHIINKWTDYFLFKKWTAFLLLLFWIIKSPVRKKLIYSSYLIIIHFFSVVSSLIIFTIIAPNIADKEAETWFPAINAGILAMITLSVIWVKQNLHDIQKTLISLKINFKLPESRINVIIIFLYLYSILNYFIIPFFEFRLYTLIITKLTELILNLLKYDVFAEDIYLYGENQALKILKSCLGLKTIIVFASLVYLTGSNNKVRWLYILSGFIFLNLVNVIRLVILFIYVQEITDTESLNRFHDIYTYIVYVVVFILWVVWIEKYADITPFRRRRKPISG